MAHYQCEGCGEVHGGPCRGMEEKPMVDRHPAPEFGMRSQPVMSANDIQVGGSHYRSEYQHWDLVIKLQLHYLAGCSSKYVTRIKSNRIEDLNKAIHYLDKAKEAGVQASHASETLIRTEVEKFAIANNLTMPAYKAIERMALSRYDEAIELIRLIIKSLKPVQR